MLGRGRGRRTRLAQILSRGMAVLAVLPGWEGVLWSEPKGSVVTEATVEAPGGHLEAGPADCRVGLDSDVTMMDGMGAESFLCSACSEITHG